MPSILEAPFSALVFWLSPSSEAVVSFLQASWFVFSSKSFVFRCWLLRWLLWSRLLLTSGEKMPEKYITRDTVWRGVNWTYPCPAVRTPEQYFLIGRQVFAFAFKSFSKSKDVAIRFGKGGNHSEYTLFEMTGQGWDISDFSQFPNEQEVLFPITSVFEVQQSVQAAAGGDQDCVQLRRVLPGKPQVARAQELEKGAADRLSDFDVLLPYLKDGMVPLVNSPEIPLQHARLVLQLRDAIVSSVIDKIRDIDVIIVVGATGSGKSTACNWLLGCILEVPEDEEEYVVRVSGGREARFAIGQDPLNSCTLLPTVEVIDAGQHGNRVAVVDFPGFLDTITSDAPDDGNTQHNHQDVLEAAFHIGIDLALQDLVQQVRSARILALVAASNEGGHLAGRGTFAKKQLDKLTRHFPAVDGRPSWLLGVTKCDKEACCKSFKRVFGELTLVAVQACPELDGHILNLNQAGRCRHVSRGRC